MSEYVSKLVEAWLDGDNDGMFFDACYDNPEAVWSAILKILNHDLTDENLSLLAAGPLESLLANHGEHFIDRVEKEAVSNDRFNYLLGGVWRQEMPIEIWERVKKARKKAW